MASEVPVARYFLVCEAIDLSPDGQSVTLRNLIHAITRLPGEPFPCERRPIAFYALLTNGRGGHDFGVELTRLDGGVERPVARTGTISRDLGQDPTVVHGLRLPVPVVVFPETGQYTFHLLCDGRPIADQHVIVR
jgi:hypothetical protein